MEEQSDYELLPHEQIEHLRRELDRLKNNPFVKGHEDDKLFAAVRNLTNSVDKLYDLFNNVQEDLVKEYGESGEGPASKIDSIIEQNKHIAEGILSLANRLEKTETKVNRHEAFKVRRHPRHRSSVFNQVVPNTQMSQEPTTIPPPQEPEVEAPNSAKEDDIQWELPGEKNPNLSTELAGDSTPSQAALAQNVPPKFEDVPKPVPQRQSIPQPSPQQQNLPQPIPRPVSQPMPQRQPQKPIPQNVPPAFASPQTPPNISKSVPMREQSFNQPLNQPLEANKMPEVNPPNNFRDDYVDANFPTPDNIPSVPNQKPQMATPISAEPSKRKKFLGIF